MKPTVLPILLVTGVLWIVSVNPAWFAQTHTVWTLRKEAIVLSGMLSYVLMAWLMLLANRPAWLERRLGGLDKLYRMHKHAGIAATLLFAAHWLIKLVPKWLAGWGWIAAKPRGAGGGQAADLVALLQGPAKDLGEWTIYAMLALVAVALLKRIPYHWFRKLHRLFALAFLVVTFHGLVLLPTAMWPTPFGVLLALCALVGSVAALRSLAGRIGLRRRHQGTITAIERLGDGIIEVACTLASAGMPHRPGQFAYLRIGDGEPHPFTIVSAGIDPREVRFAIKALGDDTREMQALRPGQPVSIEGPYGRFDFADDGHGQVWVATGIGITPFLSRLEWLAANGGGKQPITLFYCGAHPAHDPFAERLAALCRQAGVSLHWVQRGTDGPLTLSKILADNRHASQSALWFCGAQPLGDALASSWHAMGLPAQRFHRELFAMR